MKPAAINAAFPDVDDFFKWLKATYPEAVNDWVNEAD